MKVLFSEAGGFKTIDGRNPQHKNEIALGSQLVKEYKIKIGDTVELSYGTNGEEYLVTRFIQTLNNSGKAIEITGDGYRRINNDFV